MISETRGRSYCEDKNVLSLLLRLISALTGAKEGDIESTSVLVGPDFPMILDGDVDTDSLGDNMNAWVTCTIKQQKHHFKLCTNPDVGYLPAVLHKIDYIHGAIDHDGILIRALFDEVEVATTHLDTSMYYLREINDVGH